MTILTVLRSGGEYRPEHVHALQAMFREHMPGVPFMCLSDVDVPGVEVIPMEHDWPGAWAKLEVCRPDITGPVLLCDLDMVIVGDLAPLVADTSRSIVLRDFYRGRRDPTAVQSALMLLTEADRAAVWAEWHARMEWHFAHSKYWDQGVFEDALRDRALRWQDTHPGMVVGFKTDLQRGGRPVPPDARVVAFHGQPRPWASGLDWAEAPFRAAVS